MPFRDVIGHKPAIAWLQRRVAAETIGHAYLFLGPSGIGKRFVAHQLAQRLQCDRPTSDDACGQCAACQAVAADRHPDVIVVTVPEESRQIKIEQIRQLQHWLGFTPFSGRRKVAIVDEADSMQEPAASALLKTLEEPPPSAVLILIAVAESRLLPTIVSRCARLFFGPLPTAQLTAALTAQGVAPSRADAVTRMAAGRLSRARRLALPEVWDRQQAVLAEWLAAVEAGTPEPAFAARPREEVDAALEVIAAWYHDLLLIQAGADRSACLFPEREPELRRHAARWAPDRLLDALEAVYATQAVIQQRVNPRAALAVLVAKVAS